MRSVVGSSLRDRVVLITGASGSIGGAVAERIARHGARVVLTGRDRARLELVRAQLDELGAASLVIPLDLEQPEAGASLVADAVDWGGRLDAVIHSAGGARVTWFRRMTAAEFDAAIRVNFLAPVELTRAALPHLLDHDRAWVVFVNTIAAREPTPPRGSAYLSAKAGLLHFAEGLFAELRDEGLAVSSILPDLTDTALIPEVLRYDRATLIRPDSVAAAVEFVLTAPADMCVEEIRLRPQPSLGFTPDPASAS